MSITFQSTSICNIAFIFETQSWILSGMFSIITIVSIGVTFLQISLFTIFKLLWFHCWAFIHGSSTSSVKCSCLSPFQTVLFDFSELSAIHVVFLSNIVAVVVLHVFILGRFLADMVGLRIPYRCRRTSWSRFHLLLS